jgi:hypothetical protein
MKRRELEFALRAAARISREREFFLIGSQAVHAYCRRPPAEALLSQECDLYPRNDPRSADQMHLHLGRGSKFARERGFYVDVVTPYIAGLPKGWERRLKPLRFGRVTAYCLEIHDLIVTKLAAGRLKDMEFAAALLKRRIVDPRLLRRRIGQYPVERDQPLLRARLAVVARSLS